MQLKNSTIKHLKNSDGGNKNVIVNVRTQKSTADPAEATTQRAFTIL